MLSDEENSESYALMVANGSYTWYQKHAISSRRMFRLTEVLLLVLSAAIPASVLLWPDKAIVSGLLGSAIVVLTGLRAVFHWHENYLRFSRAREAVEAERRLFRTNAEPYNRSTTREQELVARVTQIEQEEMGAWMQIAAKQPTNPSVDRTPPPPPVN